MLIVLPGFNFLAVTVIAPAHPALAVPGAVHCFALFAHAVAVARHFLAFSALLAIEIAG